MSKYIIGVRNGGFDMAAHNNKFIEEQIQILRSNPYVRSANENKVSFTAEFKEEYWRLYTEEKLTPSEILVRMGIDYHMLGYSRVCGISHNIKTEHKRYGSFANGNRRAANLTEQLPTDQEVKRLRMEVEYLRQEQEFLKKLMMAGKEGK